MAFRSGHMQARAVLSGSVGERVDKHADGHIRGTVLVHLLPDEPGGQRRVQASGGDHLDYIADDHHAVGHLLRPAAHGGGQRQPSERETLFFCQRSETGLEIRTLVPRLNTNDKNFI